MECNNFEYNRRNNNPSLEKKCQKNAIQTSISKHINSNQKYNQYLKKA